MQQRIEELERQVRDMADQYDRELEAIRTAIGLELEWDGNKAVTRHGFYVCQLEPDASFSVVFYSGEFIRLGSAQSVRCAKALCQADHIKRLRQ